MKQLIYVDDEYINHVHFEQQVQEIENAQLAATFELAEAALQFCKSNAPDLAFLDVEMPGKNGLWLASELSKLNISFVFVTAHDKYALSAFDLSALHYIQKPISKDQISEVLNRHEKITSAGMGDQLNHLSELLSGKSQVPQRIFINTQKQIIILQLDEIVYVEADGSYSKFYMQDGTVHTSGKNMKANSEVLLQNPSFVKIHRSYIVNQGQLTVINKKKTELNFCFKNGMNINLATFRRDEFLDKFV